MKPRPNAGKPPRMRAVWHPKPSSCADAVTNVIVSSRYSLAEKSSANDLGEVPSPVSPSGTDVSHVSAPGNNGDLEGCSTRCDLVSSNQKVSSSVLDDSSSGGQGLLLLSHAEVTEPGLADADLVSKDAQSLDVGGSHYSLEFPVGAHHVLDFSSGNADQLDGSSLAHELVVPTPDSIKRLSRKYSLDDSPQEGDSSENIEAARDGYQMGKVQSWAAGWFLISNKPMTSLGSSDVDYLSCNQVENNT
ncbi:hypothetical protein Nepgr_024016 [Nepenthes gracilis]|uniref:Uncharacterized protein n=1 Tax=Nepenthes gracilis TaxID=150966 RepID=A0AAD3T212_NEPGR|nr:hypothetical protein Nepgr_024016 [Nepenthes gracilis]